MKIFSALKLTALNILNLLSAIGTARSRQEDLGPGETTRIYLGNDAKLGQFPYQIGFREISESSEFLEKPFCGGFLIHPLFVITAAHCCVLSVMPDRAEAYAGGLHVDGSSAEEGIFVNISDYRSHPDYVNTCHDICVVKLEDPMPVISGRIGLAKLPQLHERPAYGEFATLSGWGDYLPHEQPDVLKFAPLMLRTPEFCYQQFQNLLHDEICVEGELCAGYGTDDTPSSCFGDSGGPLTQGDTVIGLVSRGDFRKKGSWCKDIPTIFTKVSSYIQWIEETVEELRLPTDLPA